MSGSEVSNIVDEEEEFRCRYCGQSFTAAEKHIHIKNPCAEWLAKKKSKASANQKEKDKRGKTRAKTPETEDASLFTEGRPLDDLLSVPSLKRGQTPTDKEEVRSKNKKGNETARQPSPKNPEKQAVLLSKPSLKRGHSSTDKEEVRSKNKKGNETARQAPPKKPEKQAELAPVPLATEPEEQAALVPVPLASKPKKQSGERAIRRSKKNYNNRVIGTWIKGNGA